MSWWSWQRRYLRRPVMPDTVFKDAFLWYIDRNILQGLPDKDGNAVVNNEETSQKVVERCKQYMKDSRYRLNVEQTKDVLKLARLAYVTHETQLFNFLCFVQVFELEHAQNPVAKEPFKLIPMPPPDKDGSAA